MNHSKWFRKQLKSSSDGFIWAVQQFPKDRLYEHPPIGDWSAARHVFHMAYYEQHYALPTMRIWVDEPMPSYEGLNEDLEWGDGHDIKELLRNFKEVRYQQIALLSKLESVCWTEPRETLFHLSSLLWVVSKTYQHTAEHTNTILQLALFWDWAVAQAAATHSQEVP